MAVGALICCVLFAGAANAALVKVGNLVLTADGGFTPRILPRSSYAPINFEGHANLRAVDGSVPAAAAAARPRLRPRRQAEHGRAARLPAVAAAGSDAGGSARPLPRRDRRHRPRQRDDRPRRPAARCRQLADHPLQRTAPGRQADGDPARAHDRARGAELRHHDPDRKAPRRFPLPGHGRPAPDRRRRAARSSTSTPRSASATASAASERSYVSARCGDGVLRTHGRFTFADGTIIDGSVEKACTVR